MGMRRRMLTHWSAVRKGQMQPFICALRKYGEDAFIWEELFHGIDKPAISAAEIEAIALHKAEGIHLYNVTDGGDGAGSPRTPEQLAKMRGRKVSPEQRKRMSASWTPERRAAQAEKMRNRIVSNETREKSRNVMLGKKLPESHREQIRRSKLGNNHRLGTGKNVKVSP